MLGRLRAQGVGDPLSVRGRPEHGFHQGWRGTPGTGEAPRVPPGRHRGDPLLRLPGRTGPTAERGAEPSPAALNSAADTSAGPGTSRAGSSGIRGTAGTSAVVERASPPSPSVPTPLSPP
ncbi:hypothetical protein GCM10010266_71170 [Streptomyces griseomycini]|nr:hypothetical protein GCM10010266_71170 [Streptomyces griseomycini]